MAASAKNGGIKISVLSLPLRILGSVGTTGLSIRNECISLPLSIEDVFTITLVETTRGNGGSRTVHDYPIPIETFLGLTKLEGLGTEGGMEDEAFLFIEGTTIYWPTDEVIT